VDPSLPDQLARGIVQIQYRVENVRIVPVFGAGALKVSPRVGHLHITVDDLPWHWADTNDNNTIDVVGLPPGQHKVLIELVNPEHHVFTRQGQMVTFAVPGPATSPASPSTNRRCAAPGWCSDRICPQRPGLLKGR
jgi:hypothetical protein